LTEVHVDLFAVHPSSHVEYVHDKDDQTTTLNTTSELSNKDKNTITKDGYVGNNYGEVSKSAGLEALASYPIYDDVGVIEPNYDVDSMPYHIYEIYDDAGMIVPESDKGRALKTLSWDIDLSSQEPCMEDDKEEVDMVDEKKSKILYEDDSPHESHH
jgi:hypothetical protein